MHIWVNFINPPFFIFSHPTETWAEAQETLAVIDNIKNRCEISVSIAHIYPGTELEKRAYKEGKLPQDFTWTKEREKRVILLPAAQGHAPLYIDKLTWWQLSELIFRFTGTKTKKKRFSRARKIPGVLKNIYSFADVRRYTILFLVFSKYTLKKLMQQIGGLR